ncbi:hypothetical protein FBY35_4108 [Streptomyces sp. SLBN-118]|uniref:hypothetical protein n=1 Tax=Streptomyces sp. SLBN-118 TaxID=2768454 RepID=UPI00114DDEA0|nr:hypothetical protein [Streptomyces sp. SLBN-118]TQK42680.1 hypothetical protein FBY35_4108 [Streptomyces sp. SLBN-118]
MNATHAAARPFTTPQWALDAYRFPATQTYDLEEAAAGEVDAARDHVLPSPDPVQRFPYVLPASDRHRLDLHAALTTKGIAPRPGDLDAISALCTLDDDTLTTVVRWITGRG